MTQFGDVLADERVGRWRWSERTGALEWSPAMFEFHEREVADGAPRLADWLVLLEAGDAQPDLAAIIHHADVNSVAQSEASLVRADGTERHFSLTVYVSSATPGAREVTGVMRAASSTAPTGTGQVDGVPSARLEFARTMEALRTQAAELEAAQALANVGTWVFELDTSVMRWSDEMFRIHGLSPETFVPTIASAASVIVPEDRESVEHARKSLHTKPRVGPYNYRVKLPTGQIRHLVGAARIIRASDGIGLRVLGTALDVTPRIELEAMLLHAQKLDGLGRLAGGVAHDFNNALTAILANADAALEMGSNGVEDELHEITNAALRASEIAKQLLTFARRDTTRAQRVTPNDLLASLSRTLGRLVGEDVEVAIRYAPHRATVIADPARLEQVILNLVMNARDAMPSGGTLAIETSIVVLDAAYVARQVDAALGPHLRLEVRDTGIGMDAATKSSVFEPFFTTKGAGLGTGLGLSTCYGVVRQAGGHIAVESEVGAGTSFSVYLPVAEDEVVAPTPPPPTRVRRGGTETILVVEDDLGVRRVLLRTLRALGYTVVEAVDGLDAIERARDYAGSIDLMLSDVVMPGMRGPDAARVVRTLRPGIQVLFITGYAGEDARKIWDEGPVLGKPFTPDALAGRLRDLLDTRPPGDGSPNKGAPPTH